jgi:hypothetical protein
MCLRVTDDTRRITDKDIVCYKLFRLRNGVEFAPFRYNKWTIGKLVTVPKSEIEVDDESGVKKIEFGIHSFAKLSGARALQKWFREYIGDSYTERKEFVVRKCTIPAGSIYYEGLFEDEISYVSDQIIVSQKNI